MKCLSIKEPFASLIINGYKKYEFRSWKTNYRGKILIHASKSYAKVAVNRFEKLNLKYFPGCIIGEAEIIDCILITKEFEDSLKNENKLVYGISGDRKGYAWVLSNIKKYDKLIEVNGKLGLWEYK